MTLSTRMIRQVSNIASPYSDYSMKLTNWVSNPNKRPRIESMAFTINGKTNCTYSRLNMQNGSAFEVFTSNNDFLKVLKDRFGTILGYKTNLQIPLGDVVRVYHNSAKMISSRVNSLLTIPSTFRATK